MVATSIPPYGRTSSVSCSFISCTVRWSTRATPDAPTNMWCASSFSMNSHVRDSGSKPLSRSDASWNLPSRSVK